MAKKIEEELKFPNIVCKLYLGISIPTSIIYTGNINKHKNITGEVRKSDHA